ncbi:MAG: hypothetical protein PHE53_11980 [Thermoguttaceae bacterium]|nr:hypothetical protein [Thermoguttaceae bacterium]
MSAELVVFVTWNQSFATDQLQENRRRSPRFPLSTPQTPPILVYDEKLISPVGMMCNTVSSCYNVAPDHVLGGAPDAYNWTPR